MHPDDDPREDPTVVVKGNSVYSKFDALVLGPFVLLVLPAYTILFIAVPIQLGFDVDPWYTSAIFFAEAGSGPDWWIWVGKVVYLGFMYPFWRLYLRVVWK